MSGKPSIFEDGEGEGPDPLTDQLGAFRPKGAGEGRGADRAAIDAVTAGSRFRSRGPFAAAVDPRPTEGRPSPAGRPFTVDQPSPVDLPATIGQPPTKRLPLAKRLPLVYRTGRNTTFSAKTTPETVEAFYRIAREQGWKAGETFERAVAALEASLKRGGKGG